MEQPKRLKNAVRKLLHEMEVEVIKYLIRRAKWISPSAWRQQKKCYAFAEAVWVTPLDATTPRTIITGVRFDVADVVCDMYFHDEKPLLFSELSVDSALKVLSLLPTIYHK